VTEAVETLKDWASLDPADARFDAAALARDRQLVPTRQDGSLNLLVNPTRNKVGGCAPDRMVHQLELASAYARYEKGAAEPSFTLNAERLCNANSSYNHNLPGAHYNALH
jgi:hypothetical protein